MKYNILINKLIIISIHLNKDQLRVKKSDKRVQNFGQIDLGTKIKLI